MPYDSFTCPNCEQSLRVVWPEPLPAHYHPLNSKITMKCPSCGEVNEVYGFIIDKIKSAPEPGIPSASGVFILGVLVAMLTAHYFQRFSPTLRASQRISIEKGIKVLKRKLEATANRISRNLK
jgi:hypothetical protein